MSPRVPDRSPSIVSMAFLGRSVLSLRRNQVASMDNYPEEDLQDLDLFQSFVSDRLLSLEDHDHPLSFSFLQRLLDVLVSCQDEFKNLLARNHGIVAKPPLDHLLTDLLDRAVKCLDICNAVRQNLQSVRHWNRNADIAASAIPTCTSPTMRTKKALSNLLVFSGTNQTQESRKPERAWSFRCKSSAAREESSPKSWSASKQVQAMSAGLTAPRVGEAGLAFAVYTMSSVIVFSMWALVAAFPCQERSSSLISTPVVPPKQLAWAASMFSLEEKIAEEWRRRGRREGILMEFVGVERIGKEMMDLVEEGGEMEEVVAKAGELGNASRRLEEGLGPFERQVRELFHRVVESRAEVMKFLEQATKSAPPFFVL